MSYGPRVRPHRRRTSGAPLLVLVLLVVGVCGGAFLLHTTGAVRIAFLESEPPPAAAPDLTGYVRIPSTGRPVAAYEAVTREDLWDARTGTLSTVLLRRGDVPDGVLTALPAILGRVLRREKPAGYVFTEADFYPEGTRPGPTAGVPPGKRAMRLQATDVPGLHGLNQGDRFDLVMTVSVELEELPLRAAPRDDGLDVEGPYASLRLGGGSDDNPEPVRVKRKHAEVKTIVRNGTVVVPVHQRKEISKAASLLRGSTLQATPIEELIIAVAPEEVAALNHALAVGASLQVAMRSGQTDGTVDEGEIPDIEVQPERETPEEEATEPPTEPPVGVVEVIVGGEKHLQAVPRRVDPSTREGVGP